MDPGATGRNARNGWLRSAHSPWKQPAPFHERARLEPAGQPPEKDVLRRGAAGETGVKPAQGVLRAWPVQAEAQHEREKPMSAASGGGPFEFVGGYPTPETARRAYDTVDLNRARNPSASSGGPYRSHRGQVARVLLPAPQKSGSGPGHPCSELGGSVSSSPGAVGRCGTGG